MPCFRKILATVLACFVGSMANASTVSAFETFSFSATVTEAGVLCGEYVGTEIDCDALFGTYSGGQADEFVAGMVVGGTYKGQVKVRSDGGLVRTASCKINNKDCNFGLDFLAYTPATVGPVSRVEFADFSSSHLAFDFNGGAGSAEFTTDYLFGPNGVHYYAGTTFELSDVSYSLTPVPLPASVGFLLMGLGGLALARRRQT